MEREEALKLYHAITGNMKDAVIQGEQFVDEWLEKDKFHLMTADNVTIKDPEQIVYKVNPSSWGTSQPKAKNVQQVPPQCTMRIYSTKEARSEYILMNKPLFSISDLQEIDEGRDTERVLISETSLRIQAGIKLAENK